jgi:hypothetical protein
MALNTQDEFKRERKWKTNTVHNMSNTNVANVQCIYILTEVGNWNFTSIPNTFITLQESLIIGQLQHFVLEVFNQHITN